MTLTTLYDKKIFLWVLIGLPLIASTNIDCGGKSFHCFNSTHFMICVDLGGGVSTTIDDYFIPCPPPTVCSNNNQYECQFPQSVISSTTVAYTTAPSSVRVTNEFESTTPLDWEQIDVVTSLPFNTSVGHLEVQKNSNASVTESLLLEVTTVSVIDNNRSENVTEIIPIPNTTIDQRVPATDRNVISDTNVKIINQTESVVDVSINNATVVPEVISTPNVTEVNANETIVISEPVTTTNVSNNNKTAEKETYVLNLSDTTNENVTTLVTDSVSGVDSPVENKKPTLIESDLNSNTAVTNVTDVLFENGTSTLKVDDVNSTITLSPETKDATLINSFTESTIAPEIVITNETSNVVTINETSLISESSIFNKTKNSIDTPISSVTEDSTLGSPSAGTDVTDVLFENETSSLKVNDIISSTTLSPKTKDPILINSSTVSTIAAEIVIMNATSDVAAINETSQNITISSTPSVTEDSILSNPNAGISDTDVLFENETSSLKVNDVIYNTTLLPETKDPILINSSAVSTIAPEVVIMNETSGIAAINEPSLTSETSTLTKNKNNDTSNVELNSTVISTSDVTEDRIMGSTKAEINVTDVLLNNGTSTITVNDKISTTSLSPEIKDQILINSSAASTIKPEIVILDETSDVAVTNETSLVSEKSSLTKHKNNDTGNVELNSIVTSTPSLTEDSIVGSTNAETSVTDELFKNETSTFKIIDISSSTTLLPETKGTIFITDTKVDLETNKPTETVTETTMASITDESTGISVVDSLSSLNVQVFIKENITSLKDKLNTTEANLPSAKAKDTLNVNTLVEDIVITNESSNNTETPSASLSTETTLIINDSIATTVAPDLIHSTEAYNNHVSDTLESNNFTTSVTIIVEATTSDIFLINETDNTNISKTSIDGNVIVNDTNKVLNENIKDNAAMTVENAGNKVNETFPVIPDLIVQNTNTILALENIKNTSEVIPIHNGNDSILIVNETSSNTSKTNANDLDINTSVVKEKTKPENSSINETLITVEVTASVNVSSNLNETTTTDMPGDVQTKGPNDIVNTIVPRPIGERAILDIITTTDASRVSLETETKIDINNGTLAVIPITEENQTSVDNAGTRANETISANPGLVVQNANTILAPENQQNVSEVISMDTVNEAIPIVNETSTKTNNTNEANLAIQISASKVTENTKLEHSSANRTLNPADFTVSEVNKFSKETTTINVTSDVSSNGPMDIENVKAPRPTGESAKKDIITTNEASALTNETETKLLGNNGTPALISNTEENPILVIEEILTTTEFITDININGSYVVTTPIASVIGEEAITPGSNSNGSLIMNVTDTAVLGTLPEIVLNTSLNTNSSITDDFNVKETTKTTQTQTGYTTNIPKETTFKEDIVPTISYPEDTIATKFAPEKYLTISHNTKDIPIQDFPTTNVHIGNNVITPNTTSTSESKVDSLNAENNSKPLHNVTSPPGSEKNSSPKLSGNIAETAILGENEVVSNVILPQTITGTTNTSKESTVIENKILQDTDKISISAPQILPNFNVGGIPNDQVEQIKITTVVPDVDIATISISEDTSNIVLPLPNKLENQDDITMERNTSDVKQSQTSNETGINVISNVNKPVQDILTSNDFTDKTGLNMRDTTETISVLNEGLENYSGLNSEASSTDTEIPNSALVSKVVIKTDNVASISVPNVHTDNKIKTEIVDSSITTIINAPESNVHTLSMDNTTTKEEVAVEPEKIGNTPPTTMNTTYDSTTKNESITSMYAHSLDKNISISEDSNGHSTNAPVTETNIVNTTLPVIVILNTSYSEKASKRLQPDLVQSEDSATQIVLTQDDKANDNIMETLSDGAIKSGLSTVMDKLSGLDLPKTTSELKIVSTGNILETFISDHTTKTTIDRSAAATPIAGDAAMPINQNPFYSTENGLLDTAVTEETYLPSHTNNKQIENTEISNTQPRTTSMQPVNSHVAGDSTKTLNEILDNFRKDVILRQPGAIDLPTTINTTNPDSVTNSESTSSGTIEHTDTLALQTNIIMQNETNIPSFDIKNSLTTLNGPASVSSSTPTTIRTISIQPASSTESSNVIRPSDSFTVTNRSYSAVMEKNLLTTPIPLEESSPQNTDAVFDTTGMGPNTRADRETYYSSTKTYDNSEISTVQPSIPSKIFTTSTKNVDNMESPVSNNKIIIIDGQKIIPLPRNNTNERNSTSSATDKRSENDSHSDVKNPLENLVINSQQIESYYLTSTSTSVPAVTLPPTTTNVNSVLSGVKPNETQSEILASHTQNGLQDDHGTLNKTMNNNGLPPNSLVNNTKDGNQAPQVIVVNINKIDETTNNKTNVIQGPEANSSDSTSNNDNIATSGKVTNNTAVVHFGKVEANVTPISTTSKYTNKGKPTTESDLIYEMLRNSQTVPISKTPVNKVLNEGNVVAEDSKLPQPAVPDFDKGTSDNFTALVQKSNGTQAIDKVPKDIKSMIMNHTAPPLLTSYGNNDTVLAQVPVAHSNPKIDNIEKESKNVTDTKWSSVPVSIKNNITQATVPAQSTVNNITHTNVGKQKENTNQKPNQNLHPVPGFVKNNVNNVTVSTLTTSIVSMVTSNSGVNVTETKFMNSSVTIYTSPGQSSLQTSTEHPVVTSPTITFINTTKTTKAIAKTNEKVNGSVSHNIKLPADKNLPKITTTKPIIASATTTETAKKVNTEQTKASTQYPLISSTTTERYNRKLNFDCRHRSRGRYSDNMDCRKFYICFGRRKPIQGMCPANTVFSEIKKQCTKNLSHCIRENQFKCVANGRFSDFFKQNVYYICVANSRNEFVRFKFQCQKGYKLNKETVRCVENIVTPNLSISIDSETIRDKISAEDSEVNLRASDRDSNVSKSERKRKSDRDRKSDKERKSNRKRESDREREKKSKDARFECEEEGKFPDPNNCRKYYVCSKSNRSEQYRRRRKKCDSDEVFDKDKSRCVDAESS